MAIYINMSFVKQVVNAYPNFFPWGNVSAIDCPEGFLKEWWSLFWDIYCSRLSQANEVGAAEPSPEVLSTESLIGHFSCIIGCKVHYRMYSM